MSFELREHTADIAVEATGPSMDGVFGSLADGLAAAMCEDIPDAGSRFALDIRAESREAALFDYLDELIYRRDVDSVLPVANEAHVRRCGDEWTVSATARGVPLQTVSAREIKAVTYSEMVLTRVQSGWRAYVVFDV
jgi:SHS2 domain-containing protein